MTLGLSLSRRDRGCPIPPAAPRTVTLESYNEMTWSAWRSGSDEVGNSLKSHPGDKPDGRRTLTDGSMDQSSRWKGMLTSLAEAEKARRWIAPKAMRAAAIVSDV